ncbi:MAG: ABC transporter ATP-binding protein [Gammaproteobacteria bacterium]
MTAAISFENVARSYGAQKVLRGVSFEVRQGEFLGLVGVNGAGKTTLIKGLLDLGDIDSGNIRIFDISHRQPHSRQRLAYLPERFSPPYYARGEDFLRFMARMYDCSASDAQREAVLAALDLDPSALSKPVRALSKGMAQKLGLAAVMLSGKALYVLDEPMSGLDPRARALFKQHLMAQRHSGAQTLFFSTHLLPDVEALCDRMVVLHDGVPRFIGTPAECCAAYDAPDLETAYLRCVAD